MEKIVLIIFIPILIFLLYSCSWLQKFYKIENFESGNDIFAPVYSKIPNVIWTFWDGEEPELVKRCIGSWKKHNPEYKVIVLNKTNLKDYLSDDIDSIPHTEDFIQRFADFVRVNAVKKYGGIWMDASIICQRSLMWIHDIQNQTGSNFICYYRDDFTTKQFKNTAPITENWFFASVKEGRYITDLYSEMMRFSSIKKVEDYLDELRSENIDFQKLPPERYDYLVMYLIGSAVLQRKKYNVTFIKSDNGPLRHWIKHGFDAKKGAEELLQNNDDHRNENLIKIVGIVRNEMIKMTDDYSVLF
jgi:hypothetical protein